MSQSKQKNFSKCSWKPYPSRVFLVARFNSFLLHPWLILKQRKNFTHASFDEVSVAGMCIKDAEQGIGTLGCELL